MAGWTGSFVTRSGGSNSGPEEQRSVAGEWGRWRTPPSIPEPEMGDGEPRFDQRRLGLGDGERDGSGLHRGLVFPPT